LKGIEDL